MLLFYRPARPRPNTADTLAGGLGQLGQSLGAPFRTTADTYGLPIAQRRTSSAKYSSTAALECSRDPDGHRSRFKGMDRTESLGGRWSGQSGQRVVPRLRSGSKSLRYNGALYGFEEKRIVGRADRARLEGDAR